MADKIQLTLENMIPELETFVQDGIFKKSEVKTDLKKESILIPIHSLNLNP